MAILDVFQFLNYGLVLIFGLFLSTMISGGCRSRKQWRRICALGVLFLLIQCLFYLFLGLSATKRFYPLIVHLPLVLILIFALKKPAGMSLVSVFTAYLCCQLPRWVNLVLTAITHSPLVGEIFYTLSIFLIFYLLRRHFVQAAHSAMAYSSQTLFLFGSLPAVYYIFDYLTTVYSNLLYNVAPAMLEFFPTVLIIFYVFFLTLHHLQIQKGAQAELERSILEAELKQSAAEMENLRQSQTQTAIYQHDMRHHLNAIEGFLAAGDPARAEAYIKEVHADLDTISPTRFCENDLVNLLCSSFTAKALQRGIQLRVDVQLPAKLPLSDTELGSILSNALENAFHAVEQLKMPHRQVELYCGIKLNKLLIQVVNSYEGEISMENDLPVSSLPGHGFGCRSIRSITELHRGMCTFEAEHGIFTLRVVIPIQTK